MNNLIGRIHGWAVHTIRTVCRILILGVSIAGLILLLADGISKFFTSSEFTVEEIEVSGNQRVTNDEILALTAIAPGTNIWMLNLEELGARLEKHPSVRSASVQRIPPKIIHITIEEREAIAYYLQEDGELMGIGAEGVTLPPPASFHGNTTERPISQEDISALFSHPILDGDIALPEAAGERTSDPQLKAVLGFLQQLQIQAPVFFQEIIECEREENGNIVLHMRTRVGVVILRDLHSPDLVIKIKALWDVLKKEQLRAVYVDGRFPEKGFAIHADNTQNGQWEQMQRHRQTL